MAQAQEAYDNQSPPDDDDLSDFEEEADCDQDPFDDDDGDIDEAAAFGGRDYP